MASSGGKGLVGCQQRGFAMMSPDGGVLTIVCLGKVLKLVDLAVIEIIRIDEGDGVLFGDVGSP